MIHRIYAILDKKAEAGLMPFFSVNDATACRSVAQAMNDPNHSFHSDAPDFTLYVIGQYDDTTLRIEAFPTTEVCPLMSLITKE